MHANDVFCAQKSFPMISEMRVSMVAIVHLDHNGHSLRQEVIWCQARVRFGRPPLTSPIYLIKALIIRTGRTESNAQFLNMYDLLLLKD